MELVEHSQVVHKREYSMDYLIGIKCRDMFLKKRVYARAKSKQANVSLETNNGGLYRDTDQ